MYKSGTAKSVGMTGALTPDLSKGGQPGWRRLFHNIIICNFMFYEDRVETRLLQVLRTQKNQTDFL